MENNYKFQTLFHQFLLKNQCFTDKQLDTWIDKIKSKPFCRNSRIIKETAIMNANKTFRNYGLSLKKIFNETNNEVYYVLTNDIVDVIASKSTWTSNENNFYYLILDTIMGTFLEFNHEEEFDLSKHLSIGVTFANNLSRKINLTIILGEKLIENWINQFWFEKIDSATKLTIGPRTMVQKSQYLLKKYNLVECKYCCLVCLYGYRCSNCNYYCHTYCLQQQEQTMNVQKCSTCNGQLMSNQIFNHSN